MAVAPALQVDDGSDDPDAACAASVRKRQSNHRPRHEEVVDGEAPHSQRLQFFSGLEPGEVKQVVEPARILRKGRGEFVYTQGDPADSVYVLNKGRVKLSVLAESGKEFAIDLIQQGELFGEFALIDEASRSNMVQAIDDVRMWVFDKLDFVRLLESQPKLALNYIRMAGDRRRRMEKKLSDITSKDVSSRICELLYELSGDAPDAKREERGSLIPLMQHDVASLIGAARQTTTSILNDLERRHIIELGHGWIRLKRPQELRRGCK
jgi:CRP/FNR family cyclic AMP-dependent transcriptional regulator